jgi:hypothetical protein
MKVPHRGRVSRVSPHVVERGGAVGGARHGEADVGVAVGARLQGPPGAEPREAHPRVQVVVVRQARELCVQWHGMGLAAATCRLQAARGWLSCSCCCPPGMWDLCIAAPQLSARWRRGLPASWWRREGREEARRVANVFWPIGGRTDAKQTFVLPTIGRERPRAECTRSETCVAGGHSAQLPAAKRLWVQGSKI